jgi:hypothetical protein
MLRKCCDENAGDPRAMVASVFALTQVFGNDLKHETRVLETTASWLDNFYRQGVLATVCESFSELPV